MGCTKTHLITYKFRLTFNSNSTMGHEHDSYDSGHDMYYNGNNLGFYILFFFIVLVIVMVALYFFSPDWVKTTEAQEGEDCRRVDFVKLFIYALAITLLIFLFLAILFWFFKQTRHHKVGTGHHHHHHKDHEKNVSVSCPTQEPQVNMM